MIATYIQELLATNNRVIVPNYGAFLVRATSKSKDANTLDEKLKDIYFSPFLKFNDELLEKYIIKKETITKEQAAEKISQFIEDIKKELDLEKTYEIKDFGKFSADKQGKVQFTTFAKEAAEDTPEDKKVEPKTSVAKKASTKKAETKSVKEVEEVKKVEPKVEPKKETKLEEFVPEEKIEPAKQETAEKPKTTTEKPIYSYKKEKKPVNKGLVWAIALGVPIAIIFVWAILNFSTIEKVLKRDKTKSKTEQVVQKKTAEKAKKETAKPIEQKTESVKTENKSGQPKTKTQEQKPTVKKYYIIAGSFKNEKYADLYLTKLKSQGYNAEKLEKRNGMYAVSFSSFAEKNKAIAEYKFLAQEKGLQAWILYY